MKTKRVYKNFSITGKSGNYKIRFVPGFIDEKSTIKTLADAKIRINRLRKKFPKSAMSLDKKVKNYKGKGTYFGKHIVLK